MTDRADTNSDASSAGRRLAGPLLIGIALIVMLAWTWNRWCDPLVDFGRELYVPWQLAAGKVLYRDIAHLNGPLSQYLNALLFKIFGTGLRVLELANIVIAIGVIVMIWKLSRTLLDELSAAVACLLFVLLFMCVQYVQIGNYNWITPYSHELTHGIALSLLGLSALQRFLDHRCVARAALVGFCAGLIFLTKPEVFLASFAALTIGIGFRSRHLGTFALAMLAPIALAMCITSVHGALGGWNYVFNSRINGLAFYRQSMGLDQPIANLSQIALQSIAFAAMLAPALLIDRHLRRKELFGWMYAFALLLGLIIFVRWRDFSDPFRFVLPTMIVLCALSIRRGPFPFAVCLFATLLLLKIALAVRIFQYGFALAMPSVLIIAAILIHRGGTVRATALALATFTVFTQLTAYGKLYHDKPIVVRADGRAEFRSDLRGEIVNNLSAALEQLPADATVAVVPQGVMINYLSARRNSTPYVTLMPPEVIAFGDERIAASYEQHPPDYVVVIPEQFGEYGFDSFEAFAPRTAAWIRGNYSRVAALPDRERTVIVLKHNS